MRQRERCRGLTEAGTQALDGKDRKEGTKTGGRELERVVLRGKCKLLKERGN